MAKVIVWNLVTLDGFYEGEKKWDLEFHNRAWGGELEAMANEFGDKAGLLVFGRVTYEGMRDYWTAAEPSTITTYMNALPKLVASRTQSMSEWNNTVMTADIDAEIARRRKAPGKDVYVFGSAELSHSLMGAGLVDEVMLCVVPVTLGKGNRFFKGGAPLDFDLLEARPLSNGSVILRYKPRNAD
ncbi:dihydrofolate reductase [Rhizobium sp. KVB221]|uniref:Dihydrofolate reductase n=1 Tax=Rhizobium setariae TaxID=2801340 RepID=A0A936YSI6_9HYPH|nr:dihydrofolate reductase family protein [Rhizobium setariae]MBL0371862.1 dihydrofolate reductase [Rhizobium setariae]